MPIRTSDPAAGHHHHHDGDDDLDAAARRPGNNRKRASKACLACRSRKVRCDVSQRGKPCMNCFLDGESCVVIGRASKRRKPRDNEPSETAEEAASWQQHHEKAASEYPTAHPQPLRGDHLAARAAAAAADGPDAVDPESQPTDGWTRPQASLHRGVSPCPTTSASPGASRPDAWQPQPPRRASDESRPEQLQWVGERSMKFGSDITYTFYPFLETNNVSHILPQDVSYLEMQGCFRVPTKPVLDELVKQYFLHVHPIMPLFNEGDFWEMYSAPAGTASGRAGVSLLVFQAMLFSACRYISRHAIRALGFSDMRATRSAFYRRAKLLFDFESDSSPIATAQAALLLSSWIPNAGQSRAYTGSTWLGVAIQQAKLAEAHRYASVVPAHWTGPQPAALRKHQNSLKRLWWCIIMYDRVLAVCTRRPLQITRAHFDVDAPHHAPLGADDLADEMERSRVYNPGTRKALVDIFALHTKLAVVLTDLLVEVWPLDDAPRWEKRFGPDEMRQMDHCKRQMLAWYQEAAARFPPPRDTGPRKTATLGGHGARGAADFRHDSVLLYTNLMYMLYHSSLTRLCHHECLQLTLASISPQAPDTALAVKAAMAKNRIDIQDAASGAVDCLQEVLRLRLSRWLPLSSTACTSLPLILHIIEAKLSPQANMKLHGLRNLVESVRPDTTDWFYGAIHGIIGLAQLEEPESTSTTTTTTITPRDLTTPTNTHHDNNAAAPDGPVSEIGLHPSIYLRLALSLDWGMSHNELPNADQLSSCLLRMFATSSVNRIKTILNDGLKAGRSPSDVWAETAAAATTGPGPAGGGGGGGEMGWEDHPPPGVPPHAEDLDWSEQDQAILFGLQLGIISPDMAMEWAQDVVSPESLPTSDEGGGVGGGVFGVPGPPTPCEAARRGAGETAEQAKWKEIAGQAFSDTVDIPERNVLDAFIFRDQLPGERGPDVAVAATGTRTVQEGAAAAALGCKGVPMMADAGVADMTMAATTLLDGLSPGLENMAVGDWPVRSAMDI